MHFYVSKFLRIYTHLQKATMDHSRYYTQLILNGVIIFLKNLLSDGIFILQILTPVLALL